MDLKGIIINHKIALGIAVLAGIIYFFPQVYLPLDLGVRYQGINIFEASDEPYYLTVVNRASNGDLTHASDYIYEYKNANAAPLEYASDLNGLVERLLGIKTTTWFIILKFFFAFLMFLAWYILTYLISRSKSVSLISASLFVLGANFIGHLSPLSQIKTILWQAPDPGFLAYTRLIEPLFSFPFFILSLIFLYLLFERKTWQWVIWSGILLAVNFYLYFYFWTFLLVVMAILFIWNLYLKDFALVKKILAAVVLGLALAGYMIMKLVGNFLIGGVQNGNLPIYVATHRPIFDKIVLAGLAVYFVFLWAKRRKKELWTGYIFVLFLLLAAVVVSNEQVISGILIQQHHYYWFTNIPALFLALSLIVGTVINYFFVNKKIIVNLIVVFIVGYIFIFGIGMQSSAYKYFKPQIIQYQNYGAIYAWLNANAAKNSVIWSNDFDFIELTPVYTNNYLYYTYRAAGYPAVPFGRLEHNYFVYLYFKGVTAENIRQYLEQNKTEIGGGMIFEGQYYKDLCGSQSCFPDSVVSVLAADYINFLNEPIEQQLKKYKIDYFVWNSKVGFPVLEQTKFNFLRQIFDSGDISVFRVI